MTLTEILEVWASLSTHTQQHRHDHKPHAVTVSDLPAVAPAPASQIWESSPGELLPGRVATELSFLRTPSSVLLPAQKLINFLQKLKMWGRSAIAA